ncbi:MAG: helix-turn-helix transcriptional regulator [Rhizobium sp.]|nr:helix-turn-helix transcriptional regulator [Rhizobium sp.]
MPKETPFTAVSQKMLDAWIASDPAHPVEPARIYDGVQSLLSIKMRLTVFRIQGNDPLQWRMTPIRHSGFTTTLFDLNHAFRDQLIGEFKDQSYMATSVVPRLCQVVENQQPSIELVKTKLFGINLGYDRILLPQRTTGRPQWVISSSYARFLLDTPKRFGAFNVDDEAVVQLLMEGRTAKEIAVQLGLSHRTIEHRLDRLKERFGARNLIHLVVMLLGTQVTQNDGRDVT